MHPPLWFALGSLGIVAFAAGSFRSAAATGVLLANWIVLTLYVRFTGDQYNPYINGAADLAAGVFILHIIPVCRPQIGLASTYLFGLAWHGWYAQSLKDGAAQYYYWHAMHYMAWSQFWLALAWTGGEIVRLYRSGCYPWGVLLARRNVPDQMVRRNRRGEKA